jgi:RNA polymerase sigma factor (sigma-70 family)
MSSPFDVELPVGTLEQAARGHRPALELIYRTFETASYTLARRMCGDADKARDVLQESFLRAFDRLHQYRGDAPFGRWLRSIVANEALMQLREGRRFLEFFEDRLVDEQPRDLASVSNVDLEHALGSLPAVPRAVLWLYHVEGYTHLEIAKLSGKTVSFSKSQLSRAHAKLRQLFRIQPEGNRGRLVPTALVGPAAS